MTVTISSDTLDFLLKTAAASPDREVCGLLLGQGDRIDGVVPCANVAAEPWHRFEIDPAALIAAHRAARGGGAAVIGHYHSHPTGLAEPSPRDAADAAPDGSIWLIAGGGQVTAWRAVAAGERHGRFDPLALACA
ncbi:MULTISPECIES: M67 family metallopeptidase [unclassified Sphingomonas]|uniref:M67 family metallopeptidase n=1 Tax=unclassified Sphingomonas TaxID=196159 RepID=UPI0028676129|nr:MULTISPECIES: M67 family metallopeptidase [unclassified Sphingomonas]MDR6115291.1 proteasome lid subunit RPN8/RPN11 [Sphingomonas sp. SORGH_AS_0789]MDR6151034.1 proteasome lid subunit RPN8/RPN11 [Sphingomonas sp. SORGH_AS_0742]